MSGLMVYCKKYEDLLCGALSSDSANAVKRSDVYSPMIYPEYPENVAHSNHFDNAVFIIKMLNTNITNLTCLKNCLRHDKKKKNSWLFAKEEQ